MNNNLGGGQNLLFPHQFLLQNTPTTERCALKQISSRLPPFLKAKAVITLTKVILSNGGSLKGLGLLDCKEHSEKVSQVILRISTYTN